MTAAEIAEKARALIAEGRALLEKATPGAWKFRPLEFDDWGWIRGGAQNLTVAVAYGGRHVTEEEKGEHRRAKTDPYQANADLILFAVNNLGDLLALAEKAQRMEGAYEEHREALTDLVSMEDECDAIGGGPGWKERFAKAWSVARELVRVEP